MPSLTRSGRVTEAVFSPTTSGQMAMAANAPMWTRASMVEGRPEVGILPTGQVVGVIEELPTVAELVERIMKEAEATLTRLAGVS